MSISFDLSSQKPFKNSRSKLYLNSIIFKLYWRLHSSGISHFGNTFHFSKDIWYVGCIFSLASVMQFSYTMSQICAQQTVPLLHFQALDPVPLPRARTNSSLDFLAMLWHMWSSVHCSFLKSDLQVPLMTFQKAFYNPGKKAVRRN